MTYFEGFVAAVPEANKEAYRKHAADAAPMFQEFGVKRHVEAWDSDVSEGKVTDFRKAVDAKPDEKVVFAWFEYPDRRQARDAANEKMRSDPRMKEHGRIHAVRRQAHDLRRVRCDRRGRHRPAAATPTASSCRCRKARATPISNSQRKWPRYSASMAQRGSSRRCPTTSPKGEVTDFYRAVKAEDDEKVVFSFIEWPDKDTRDQAWQKIMADESLKPEGDMPFYGQRMFWGGFEPILDTAKTREPADA